MKKLIFLILFTLPFLLHAQYGGKDCHTDLVFGFDLGNGINLSKNDDRLAIYKEEDQFVFGFRLGTNLNYPIANRVQLVTGFRLSSQIFKTYETPLIQHEAYTEKVLHDISMEIPFRARYVYGSTKKRQLLYLEGGLDVNIYAASFAKDGIEKAFGRVESYNPFSLYVNLAPGFEMESNRSDNSFFIQPILRLQVMDRKKDSNLNFYQIGIETGIRF